MDGSSRIQNVKELAKSKWSWLALRHDLAVGLISGTVVAVLSLAGTVYFDDRRSEREARLANLTFVRERSSDETTNRPFRNMDLQGQNLIGLRMAGADLSNSNLRDSMLAVSDLTGAKLFRADLAGSTVSHAKLEKADLSLVNLRDGDLQETRLVDAILTFTDFRGANLQKADLSGADLRKSYLQGANLKEVNLSSAKIPSGTDESPCSDFSTKWPDGFSPPDDSKNPFCRPFYPWF